MKWRLAVICIVILLLGIPSIAFADSISTLDLSSEFFGTYIPGSTVAMPRGFFPGSDPTLYSARSWNDPGRTITTWTNGSTGTPDTSYWFDRSYRSATTVNGSAVLDTSCPPGSSCSRPIVPGHSDATSSGYADATRLKLGIYSSVAADAHGSASAQSEANAEVMNRFTVNAKPGSGLEIGDPVTLAWIFDFDGSMTSGTYLYPDKTEILSRVSVDAAIRGTTRVCYGESCYYPTPASFSFSAEHELYELSPTGYLVNPYVHPGDLAYMSLDARWSQHTNLGSNGDHADFSEFTYNETDSRFSRGEMIANTYSFDNPFGTMMFEAKVGQTLVLDSSIDSFLILGGGGGAKPGTAGWASNDFFHTATSSITPDSDQVYLTWDTPVIPDSPAPIPEPGSLVLLASGIAAVASKRWWRR